MLDAVPMDGRRISDELIKDANADGLVEATTKVRPRILPRDYQHGFWPAARMHYFVRSGPVLLNVRRRRNLTTHRTTVNRISSMSLVSDVFGVCDGCGFKAELADLRRDRSCKACADGWVAEIENFQEAGSSKPYAKGRDNLGI